MQKRDLPSQFVVSQHIGIEMLPLIAFIPLMFTVTIFAGMTLSNSAALDEWRMPLIGIAGMSLLAFLIGITFEFAMRWWHIRLIKQIYNDAWAIWAKYSSDEQWQKFVERNHQSELSKIHFEFIPLIIVGIVVLIIGVAAVMNNADISIIYGLASIVLLAAIIVIAKPFIDRWRINARYQRRKNAPAPAIIISPHGYYDEDEGVESLKRLQSLEIKSSPKKQSMKINFLVRFHWLEYMLADNHIQRSDKFTLSLDVPKAYADDAESLVNRFKSEVLNQ